MLKEIDDLLNKLNDVAAEKYTQGINLHDTSYALSEWNFGYADGVDHAIQMIEDFIKKLDK